MNNKEVSRLKSLIGERGQELWSAENQRADRLEAELEHVKRERDAAKEHLSAYKDTGLTPKHIQGILGSLQFYMETISPVYAVEFKKFGIERLHDLMQAEQDERLVVLPCKAGDTVWAITSPINVAGMDSDNEKLEIFECTVESITLYTSSSIQFRLYYHGEFVAWYVTAADFGKTVFLTREEAEAALKGGGK